MATREWTVPGWVQRWSWVGVSALGLMMLIVPLFDIWDDASNLSWGVGKTLLENSVLIVLAMGLVYGGIWLAMQDWDARYTWTVTKWNLGVSLAIAALYTFVIWLQMWAMHGLKPWMLALDGVLFGSVAAFFIGLYNADQRQMKHELERSREEYRTVTDDVLDTSDVATFILDSDFRVVWINEATATYFDLDRNAVIGGNKRELIDGHIADLFEDPEGFERRVTATYDDNTYTEEFECHVLPNGDREERWLKHWSQPIESGLYAGGRIEHYTDITPMKQRERELDLRERKLRELYEIISDASLSFEEQVDGIIGIGRELLGAEYGSFARIDSDTDMYELQVVQATDPEVSAGDIIPLSQTHCEQMIAADDTIQFETRPFDVDEKDYGTDVGFEMYVGTPVYENDTIYGSLCFLDREAADEFDDWQLTMVELMGNWIGYELNRKRLLEKRRQDLHDQRAKFEEFVSTVDDYAILALDTEGCVASWNQGAAGITGYESDGVVGTHFAAFYPDHAVNEGVPGDLLAEAKETGHASYDGWNIRADGSRFWASVSIAARYDEHGDHVGYTEIVQDLTEQRERERALKHERERLEFMNRIIRHNILNGLNLVNARTELLQAQLPADADEQEHLGTIHDRVQDLSGVINTMRTFMDAVLTDAEHETSPIALRSVVEEKVELSQASYPDAVFEMHDLPDPDTTVIADDLLGEVFENILSNAVVHNDKETPEVEVWVSEDTLTVPVDDEGAPLVDREGSPLEASTRIEERPALTVHIADNGPGIPDDEKASVLEKGVSELQEPGNGFGLYLVQEMVEAYGGTVDIRDNEGGGTVFDLTFLRPT